MRTIVVAVLGIAIGVLLARSWYVKPAAPDPNQVMVTQMRTHAVIEHERQVAIWYRACPEVPGVNPQIFIAWPARLSYQLELADVSLERDGARITVHTRGIVPVEPGVPTDFMDYLSSGSLFTFANEKDLINQEIRKSSPLARYLSAYFLLRDASLKTEFTREIDELIRHMAGALGVPVDAVEVVINQPEAKLPKLPGIALCEGSTASVNGYPFAKLQDQFTVPIRFEPGSGEPGAAVHGIASVYAPEPGRKPAPR
jgi:hypothetical protein